MEWVGQHIYDYVATFRQGVTMDSTLTFDSVSLSAIQTSAESFVDNDTSIMTSAAIQDKILDYGYTTNTGDITGVTFTTDDAEQISDTAGSADFTIVGGEGIDTTSAGSEITITAEDARATNKGVVELATSAECTTGTDTTRAVTPEGLTTAKVIGQYAVLRCSAFYINDNPMVQNSLYFGSATGNQPMNWNDPAAVGGVIGDTSSFTIAGDDENWGMVLPFNISKVEVKCSVRPQLGTGDDLTVAIYTGVRSTDSSADLTLTKIAHNSVNISGTINRYTQNDVSATTDLAKGVMLYVGVGTEDSTDMKNGRGYMTVTITRR